MQCHGWRSVYSMPKRPAFKGSALINLSYRLHQVLCWALGSVEILLSRHCPICYAFNSGLKPLERFSYIASVVYPLTSIPLLIYCTLPVVCLLTGKFIVPEISSCASILFMALFISIVRNALLWRRPKLFRWAIPCFWSRKFLLLRRLLLNIMHFNLLMPMP